MSKIYAVVIHRHGSIVLILHHITKFYNLTKFKPFADKSNVVQAMISDFDWINKHFGKRRKCWLLEFSPLSQCFQKTSFIGSSKLKLVVCCTMFKDVLNTILIILQWAVHLFMISWTFLFFTLHNILSKPGVLSQITNNGRQWERNKDYHQSLKIILAKADIKPVTPCSLLAPLHGLGFRLCGTELITWWENSYLFKSFLLTQFWTSDGFHSRIFEMVALETVAGTVTGWNTGWESTLSTGCMVTFQK